MRTLIFAVVLLISTAANAQSLLEQNTFMLTPYGAAPAVRNYGYGGSGVGYGYTYGRGGYGGYGYGYGGYGYGPGSRYSNYLQREEALYELREIRFQMERANRSR